MTAPALARFTLRAEPWGLLVAGWVMAAVVAAVAHMDSELELMMVSVAATIGVGSTLADPAVAFTDTTPERRWIRRARSLGPGVAGSLAVWISVTAVAAAWFDATPAPGRWGVLGLAAVVATQVAVGSLAARRTGREPGIGPAAVVALVFLTPFLVPRFGDWLYPVAGHGSRWAVGTVVALAATAWAWRDPAARSATALGIR